MIYLILDIRESPRAQLLNLLRTQHIKCWLSASREPLRGTGIFMDFLGNLLSHLTVQGLESSLFSQFFSLMC